MLHSELIRSRDRKSNRLLIMLHGLGDSIAGYGWMPEALNLPWLNYLLVNAPDSYYGGYSWYDFAGDMNPGVRRSRKMLLEVLEAQPQEGFGAGETMLGGFSQGCLMALDVGLRYPQRLAGIIGISGYVCDPEAVVKEMSSAAMKEPILMTHGTLDPLIPITLVREQVIQLKRAGLLIEWHEFVKAHTIAGETELRIIRDFIKRSYGNP